MTDQLPPPAALPPVRQQIDETVKLARTARWQRVLIIVGIGAGILAPFFRQDIAACLETLARIIR